MADIGPTSSELLEDINEENAHSKAHEISLSIALSLNSIADSLNRIADCFEKEVDLRNA